MKYFIFLAGVFTMRLDPAQQNSQTVAVNRGDAKTWFHCMMYGPDSVILCGRIGGNEREVLIANFQISISDGEPLDEISIVTYEIK